MADGVELLGFLRRFLLSNRLQFNLFFISVLSSLGLPTASSQCRRYCTFFDVRDFFIEISGFCWMLEEEAVIIRVRCEMQC